MSESVPLPHDSELQMDKTQALISQAHDVKELVGEIIAVGQRLYENHKNQPPQVKVEIDKGTTHKALWEKYSEGVQSERPIQRTLAVAQTAFKAGESPQEVHQILQHDPQYTKIQQQQGNNKAQEYTQVMSRSAAYREQQSQSGQQQSQQKQKIRVQTQKAAISQ